MGNSRWFNDPPGVLNKQKADPDIKHQYTRTGWSVDVGLPNPTSTCAELTSAVYTFSGLFMGDVPCAVETERRLGSRLRNHFRRLAEPELRVARSERRHQLRHVLAAVHAPKARGGFQHPGRDPA